MIQFIGRIEEQDGKLFIEVTRNQFLEIWPFLSKELKKCNGYQKVEFKKPYRKRTTGEHSQNSHLWGHSKDIAMQYNEKIMKEQAESRHIEKRILYTPELVLLEAKLMACDDNEYPYILVRGQKLPMPSSQSDTRECAVLIKYLHLIADENSFWLMEYDGDGNSVKTIGGKPVKELEE